MTSAEGSLNIDSLRDEVIRYAAQHPIYHDYVLARRGREVFRNTEPWHAVGEQLLAAMMTAGAGTTEQITTNMGADVVGASIDLLRATPFLWHCDMISVANEAPLPRHVISKKALPYPLMFWSLETAYPAVDGDDTGDLDWFFVADAGDRMVIMTSIAKTDGSAMEIFGGACMYGRRWPEDFQESPDRAPVEVILKLCSFLSSSFIESDPQRLPRPARRRLARAGLPQEEQERKVRVVKLRRRPSSGSREGSGVDVNHHHRWWVSGHYRAQWYPSQNAHKVIWIAPHIKGLEGKPMLEKVYDVSR